MNSGHSFKNQSQVNSFNDKVIRTKYFNAGDYRILLEGDFQLSTKEVNLNTYEDNLYANPIKFVPEKKNGYVIKPFEDWSRGTSTFWWDAYTKLKHNRLANITEATLKNTIYSIAGTFVVLTLRDVDVFKYSRVDDLYHLFLPWYWVSGGMLFPGLE